MNVFTEPHESVFPMPRDVASSVGLTKREYFAAMAMMGLCANADIKAVSDSDEVASLSIRHADALIEGLNAGGQS